ncbi:7,8-dihydropteroate synthase [Sterolibacterium denitrificans]|uniref:dihydropteroate synthase n=1 Tax=Sterolibacterium denitrificans TaxID=157592 RepID=A0A7Z7MUW2_9PROT|nr:dihydropteroate synthase [Sterolibacterium denitrificans]SMB24656.1 7,8-dihydropteroate synthase [Sterolibacterium denitrificans]
MNSPLLHCGRFELSLARPLLMGIVNLTDDSFSGDGLADDAARAIEHGQRLVAAGAQMLDIGGESSRPGAAPVSAAQELARVLPVLEGLHSCGVPLSIDSAKPEVMRAALAAGADMINDITALQAPGALEVVAASSCAVCLMHMQGEPRTMQLAPRYGDVVAEVADFFRARIATADAAGVARERIVLDPGFGFGKTLEHNLALLRHLAELSVDGLPLLAGLSRKSMLGAITGHPAHERVFASVAAALLAVQRGAAIVRVHDVAATRDALAVLDALEHGRIQ